MEFKSINPCNGEELAVCNEHTEKEVNAILEKSRVAFQSWREVPIKERCKLLVNAAGLLRKNVDRYSKPCPLKWANRSAKRREKLTIAHGYASFMLKTQNAS
jgi:succinate-semialdehyde dehydrogenase / glutarate-semialdehyde dehydrogenase